MGAQWGAGGWPGQCPRSERAGPEPSEDARGAEPVALADTRLLVRVLLVTPASP